MEPLLIVRLFQTYYFRSLIIIALKQFSCTKAFPLIKKYKKSGNRFSMFMKTLFPDFLLETIRGYSRLFD